MHLDDRVTVATPEGITIELVLAGLGSRFMARLLDAVIQVAIVIALGFGVLAANPSGWIRGGVAVLVFLVIFAYDVPFEVLNQGKTPGKAAAGIRVVGLDGEPVRFVSSAIRNILRLVDFLPAFYFVGSAAIVSTSRSQRLGDLAAGTQVMRERFPGLGATVTAPLTVPATAVTMWDVSAVAPDELNVIRQFLDRRLALDWPVRNYYSGALASRLGPKIAGAPYGAHPEYLLEGIVVAKQGRW